MSPQLAVWPAQKRLRLAQPNPTRPNPTLVADTRDLADPDLPGPSPLWQRRLWAHGVPTPPYQDLSSRRPTPGTPESSLSALTDEELRAPPRSFYQPLPPPPAPAPPPPLGTGVACPPAADSGTGSPPPRLRLRSSHCTICPSLSSDSAVIGYLSTSVRVVASSSPPLSPGHTRTHSGQ